MCSFEWVELKPGRGLHVRDRVIPPDVTGMTETFPHAEKKSKYTNTRHASFVTMAI